MGPALRACASVLACLPTWRAAGASCNRPCAHACSGPGGGSGQQDVTPGVESGFNVRTTVHEYGGGEYLLAGDAVYFSNFKCVACLPACHRRCCWEGGGRRGWGGTARLRARVHCTAPQKPNTCPAVRSWLP